MVTPWSILSSLIICCYARITKHSALFWFICLFFQTFHTASSSPFCYKEVALVLNDNFEYGTLTSFYNSSLVFFPFIAKMAYPPHSPMVPVNCFAFDSFWSFFINKCLAKLFTVILALSMQIIPLAKVKKFWFL